MINFPLETMLEKCGRSGIAVDDTAQQRLQIYGNALIEWNEKMNLTAITEPNAVVTKHFLDCALLLKYVDIPQNASFIDVGTGAGFPGMVIKILRPDINLTLLDGLNKRLIFLNDVLSRTQLCADTVHMRAEQAGQTPLREQFDVASARAVAKQNVLLEYCMPFVKVGGVFAAMKGPDATAEIAVCGNAEKILGGAKSQIFTEKLPPDMTRCFILTKKISQTPSKYPRISAKISKQPL